MNKIRKFIWSASAVAASGSFAYYLGYSVLNSYLVGLGFGEQAVVPDVLVATQYVIHGAAFALAGLIEGIGRTWPQWLMMIAIYMALLFAAGWAMVKKPAIQDFTRGNISRAKRLLEIKVVRYIVAPVSAYIGACGLVAIASLAVVGGLALAALGSYSGTFLGQAMGNEAAASPACIPVSEAIAERDFYKGCQLFTFVDGSVVQGHLHFQSNEYLFIESNDGALLLPKGDLKFAKTIYHRASSGTSASSKPVAMVN